MEAERGDVITFARGQSACAASLDKQLNYIDVAAGLYSKKSSPRGLWEGLCMIRILQLKKPPASPKGSNSRARFRINERDLITN